MFEQRKEQFDKFVAAAHPLFVANGWTWAFADGSTRVPTPKELRSKVEELHTKAMLGLVLAPENQRFNYISGGRVVLRMLRSDPMGELFDLSLQIT